MQTVLSAKDYFGLAFPFHVPTHINEIIQASRDLEMVRYAHEHLHYKFSKGTANVAANIANKLAANVVVDDYGILKYVVDNGAPVELKTLHILNRPLFDEKIESIALKRENVFIRDHHMCTYCGRRYASDDLTIDHIVPASKGGEWSWTNLTTACAKCNNRKGDKMLKQCSGMKLVRPAKEPCVASGEFSQFSRIVNPPDEWIPFIDPRHVKRIPEGFMDDLEFGDVSIKNNVVDVEKTLLKVTSKNYKKKKSKSISSSPSSSSSSSTR